MGGLEIFALDVALLTDGTEVILELNDTAIGLAPMHVDEDVGNQVILCVQRLEQLYGAATAEADAAATA